MSNSSHRYSYFRSPWFWASVAIALLLNLPSLTWSFGHDQNVFAEIGSLLLKGYRPYVDAWDIKPPNIFYLYAFAEWLFGPHEWSVRILDLYNTTCSAGLLFILVSENVIQDAGGSRREYAGLFTAAFFAAIVPKLGLADSAQTESFSLPWLIAAMLYAFRAVNKTRPIDALVAGLLLGIAIFFKTTNGFYAIPCVAIVILANPDVKAKLRYIALFVFGVIVATAVELFILHLSGALGEYLRITSSVVLRHASEVAGAPLTIGAVVRIIWIYLGPMTTILLGAFIALSFSITGSPLDDLRAFFSNKRNSRSGIVFLIALVSAAVAVLVQRKGWGYHYVILLPALVPLVAIIALPLIWVIIERWQKIFSRWQFISTVMIVVLALSPISSGPWLHTMYDSVFSLRDHEAYIASLGNERSFYYPACTKALAEYLQHHSTPLDRVFIFGHEPGAYWRSERLPASRFIYTLLFTSPVITDSNIVELGREIEHNRPTLFVVERYDTVGFSGTAVTSESLLHSTRFQPLLEILQRDYQFQDIVCDKFLIYARRAPTGIR